MRCVRASNVPHTSEQKVHSTFNCGSSQFVGKQSVLGVTCGMTIACLTANRRRATLTQCGFNKYVSVTLDSRARHQCFIFRIDRATNGPHSVYRNRATFTGERVITGSSSHTSAASFVGIPMDSMITMKVWAVGKATPNFVSQLPPRGYVRKR